MQRDIQPLHATLPRHVLDRDPVNVVPAELLACRPGASETTADPAEKPVRFGWNSAQVARPVRHVLFKHLPGRWEVADREPFDRDVAVHRLLGAGGRRPSSEQMPYIKTVRQRKPAVIVNESGVRCGEPGLPGWPYDVSRRAAVRAVRRPRRHPLPAVRALLRATQRLLG